MPRDYPRTRRSAGNRKSQKARCQARLMGGSKIRSIMFSICPFVRPSVRLLPDLWTWYFENKFDAKWHKLSIEQGHKTNHQHWGSWGQRSRSYEAEDKFGGRRDKKAEYDRKFESTSNGCCRVANDLTNTAHCVRGDGESIIHAAAEASFDRAWSLAFYMRFTLLRCLLPLLTLDSAGAIIVTHRII